MIADELGTLQSAGYGAIYGCSSIVDLHLPDTLQSIDDEAFSECSGIVALHLPGALQSIGDGAFQGCSDLDTLVLPAATHAQSLVARYLCSDCTLHEVPLPHGAQSCATEHSLTPTCRLPQACPREVVCPQRAPRGVPDLRTPWPCTYAGHNTDPRLAASDIEAFRHVYRPISVMRSGAHGIRQAIKWSADAKGVMPAARTHASGGAHSSPPGDRGDAAF